MGGTEIADSPVRASWKCLDFLVPRASACRSTATVLAAALILSACTSSHSPGTPPTSASATNSRPSPSSTPGPSATLPPGALPGVPDGSASAIAEFLAAVKGNAPDADFTKWSGCDSVHVFGADLEAGNADIGIGFRGGCGGGDGTSNFLSIRDRRVVKSALAVEGHDNSDWEKLTEPYRGLSTGQTYFSDGVTLLGDFDCTLSVARRAALLRERFGQEFAGYEPWTSAPNFERVALRRFERLSAACLPDYATKVATQFQMTGPTKRAIDEAINRPWRW